MNKTFADYNIDAPDFGVGEHRTRCPQCENTHHTRNQKDLSVNLALSTWFCHRCGWKGGLRDEPGGFQLNVRPAAKSTQTARHDIHAEFDKLQPLTSEAIAFLQSRAISQATAEAAGVKSATAYSHRAGKVVSCVAFPIMRDGNCLNIKYRPLEIKDFLQVKGGDQSAMFGNLTPSAIYICEGEFDALTLMECGFNAVSVPNGAPPPGAKKLDSKLSFITENQAAFDRAETIILAMDKDTPGLAFEKLLAEKIGLEKCLTVDYPDGCKDANECLVKYGKTALTAAIHAARAYPVAGLTSFVDHSAEILEYWQNRGATNLFSSGFASMDQTCKLQRGTLNILSGVPSHGKSEFLDQIIVNTIKLHRWKWAVFSPENYPIPNHFQKLAEKWTEKPLFNPSDTRMWSIPAMTESEVKTAIAELSKSVQILTAGEDNGDDLDGILRRIELAVRRDKIIAFVVDPWNEIEHCRPSALSETEYISQALTKLRNFARRYQVMCWIVAHPMKLQKDKLTGEYPVPTPYDISGSAHWRNKADCCFCVWRDVAANDGKVQVHIQKVRNKNAGRAGDVVHLQWTQANGTFNETGKYYRGGK